MKLTCTSANRLSLRLDNFAFSLLFTLTALAGSSALWSQTYPTQIGAESSDRPTGFIDAFKNQGRLTINSSGDAVPTDEYGNPLSDGIVVVFDERPVPAWAPPIDDPSQDQPNMSGTYTMSFTGQAILSSVAGNPTLTFSNQSWNSTTNTTTVNVYLPGGATYAQGPALMVISFTNTQLTPTSGTNTGIANLQVIRPGWTLAQAANPTQVFDPAYVAAFAPFSYIRFMGWLGTNTNPFDVSGCASSAPACSSVNTPTMGWSQRSLPTDFYQGVGNSIYTTYPSRSGAWGVSWEYVILLANATNKDVWINVPINATGSSDPYDPNYVASPDTSSYVYNLAMLFKNGDAFTGNKGLNSGLHIYIEDSNEVWNSSFLQYGWNENAAEAEVNAAPGRVSVLNNDGNTSSLTWAYRRHIKRVKEIAQIFEGVYGSGSFGTTIRPVYAWFQLDEGSGSNAAAALAWFNTNYGAPANYIYSMAQGDYFTASNYSNDTTVADVLSDMSSNSSASVSYVTSNLATANQYGLHLAVYEGGPDNSNGGNQNTVNVGPQILANRTPSMDTLVQTHIRNNYFEQGGYTFGYFALSSAYSRYGDYGATDDYRILTTSKYNALVNLTGYEPGGLPFSPGDLSATSGSGSVALSWETVPGATSYNVLRGTASGGETLLTSVSSTTSTYTDTNVANGVTYYYEITGSNSTGTGTPSNEASAVPASSVPSAPTLTATAGNTQVTLNWTAASGAATYDVYEGTSSNGESGTPIATGITGTTYSATGLTNGTTYYFEVAGVNTVGTGADSNQASATPIAVPANPTGLTATAGNAQVALSWTASSGATSYNVYEGTTSGGESSTPVATGITAASYTVTGLTNGAEYYFKVAAVNAAGVSGYSNEAPATPSGGSGSFGTPVPITIPNYSFELDNQSNYIVPQDWALTNSGTSSVVQQICSNAACGLTLTGVTGTYYWAPGVSDSGTSPYGSGTATLTTTASLGIFGPNEQYVLSAALAASNPAASQVGFELLANGVAVATFTAPTSGTNAITSTGLTNYSLTFSTVGNSSVVGENITVALVYTYTGQYAKAAYFDNVQLTQAIETGAPAPSAPTSLTATAGNAQVALTWTPVEGATSYNVYEGTASGGEGTTPIASGVDTYSYTATGLTNGTTYYFFVTAVNADGSSGDSNQANATPEASLGIPAAPTGLTATAGDMSVTLSWPSVAGASTYNIYQGTASGGEGTTPIANGVTASPYSATGLTDGTKYYFRIAAVNSYGTSGLSNEVSATPAPATQGTNSAASFSIYPQVVAATPFPVGFSIAPTAGADIGENAWLADGGFNAYDERLSLTADEAGTATTFICENAGGGTSYFQSIASGFFVGATAHTYRYSGGAWSLLRTDTVTGYNAPSGSTTPTAANSTITFAASGPATEAGDIIWLDLDDQATVPGVNQLNSRFSVYYPTWQTETQNGESASLTWPYTLSSDVPSSDSGGLSLEITDSKTETQGIWQYIQGAFVGPADEEFQPGHTYEFDVWLTQSGIASGDVTVSISGIGVSHTFTGVNGTWQRFTYSFAAPAGLPAGSSQPTVHLDYSAPGTLWVDNFQLYDTAWAPNTVDPVVMAAWQAYKPATVRIWSNFSNSGGGYSFWGLNSWLTPEIKSHNTAGIGNEYAVSVQSEHLPDALANVKTIGTANPWLIVNMSLSEVEWGELIDYLAAPEGTGYASMRPANHPGPYTADFSTIYLEVGNEEWGTQQVPADTAYGEWAKFVIGTAVSGKSYPGLANLKYIVNGFVLNPGFGSAAIAAATQASYTEAALYSNGNTSLSGDSYYQSDLVQVPVTNGPQINALVSQQQLDASNGRVYGLAAYEEGPGNSTTPGDNTLAAAIGAIDVNLYASQSGFGPQNFFLYNLGTGPWSSHQNFANGFYPHPVWEAYQMRNNYTSGPIVLTNTNSVPTYSDPTITNGQAVPLIAVYTFADANVANQADVVVISRSLDNNTPVTLNFPATPTGTANLYTLTGDPRATNDSALVIPIASTTVSVTKNYTFTMPPGSMYIFQVPMTGAWSSSGEPAPPAPVSLSASAGNEEVTLTWAASEGATGYNVLRGTVSGGPYTQIGTSTSVAYTDTAVTNGATYYYVVQATNPGGASANSPQASATPNVEDDASTTTQPPLTGANTGAWTSASFVPLSHFFDGSSTDTAQYKTLWDSNYLYLLVSVQDSYLIAPTQANIWDGETVEVYFSGTDTKSTTYGPTDFQYGFPYGSGGAVVTETKHNAVTGVIFGQENIAGGYQMAIALPWTTLGTTPVAGRQYGFDVMIDTANAQGNLLGKLAWWATANNTWDNPSLMGPLVLTGSSSVPAAPTGLTATSGNGQVTLSWTASSGATSYNVYEGTTSGGESSTPIATGVTATMYTVTGLTNGTAYYFKVSAVNAAGVSAESGEGSATPLAPPAAPTGLTAMSGSGQAALSWTASTGATSYNVYEGTSSGGESTTPVATGITATSYTVIGLTNGAAYYFKVAAVNSAGVSGYSNEVSATPSSGGYGTPVAITVPNYSFELDNQSNYIVPQDWTLTSSGTSSVVQDICSNSGCSLTLTGVTGTYYWAPAINNSGTSPYGTGTATLTTSASLGTFAANSQYTLTVALAAINPSASQVGFQLLANGVAVATFTAPTSGSNSITSTGLTNYSLTFSTVGNSSVVGENITVALVYTYTGQYTKAAYFDDVQLTQALENGLPPVAPAGLTATAGNAQVALAWTASAGATSYNVYEGTTSGGESSTPVATGITSASYTVTGLTDGTSYYFKVAAVNSSGASGYSNEASAIPQFMYGSPTAITVPNYSFELDNESSYIVPQDWTLTTSGNTSVAQDVCSNSGCSLSLTGVTGTYYWAPYIGNNGSAPYGSETATLTTTSSLGTFASNTQYVLTASLAAANPAASEVGMELLANGTVVASFVAPTTGSNALSSGAFQNYSLTFSTAGYSQYVGQSITVALVYNYTGQYGRAAWFDDVQLTKAAAVLPPAAPTGLTASAGNGQVALSWTASSGATSYDVYEGTASGEESSTPIATGVTGTTYTTSGLANGTTYYFKVAAVNAGGAGALSSEASATPVAPPAAPTGLTASAGGGQVALSWTASSGATSYKVYQGTTSGGESSTPVATGITATTYTVTGLTNGTAYYFKVAAVNAGGVSGYSNEATATPTISYGTPVAITVPNYSFELDNQSNYIVPQDWTLTSSGTSSVVQDICSNSGCSLTLTGVTGTYYWAPAVNDSGTSPYGTGTATLTTSASLGAFAANSQYTLTAALAAINPSASQVGFQLLANGVAVATFTAPTTGSNAITSTGLTNYSLTFSTVSNSSVVGENITVALVYTYTGQYTKAAYFDDVQLTQALENGLPPAAPAGLTATAGNGQVSLSWTASAGATSYNVYQGATSGGESSTPVATGVTAAAYTVTGLTDGTDYYFKVAAVNSSGVSGYSNEASAIPQFVYGSPSAITVPNYSFELDNESSYIVPQDWTLTTSGNTSVAQDVCSNSGCSNSFTGVTGTYYWAPYIGNNGSAPYGNETATLTTSSSLGTFASDTQYVLSVSLAAANPAASAVGMELLANGSVVASFVAPTTGSNALSSSAFQNYSLTFSTAGYSQYVGQSITVALVYNYTGQYGRAAYFDDVQLTQAAAVLPPAAPTNLTATGSSGQVALSWTVSSGATSYNVYQGTTSGGESATPMATGITSANHTVTGLTNGTAYYFKVAAVNAGGVSGFSNQATATP